MLTELRGTHLIGKASTIAYTIVKSALHLKAKTVADIHLVDRLDKRHLTSSTYFEYSLLSNTNIGISGMADSTFTDVDELAGSDIPITSKQWTGHIKSERFDTLQRLAQQSRKLGSFPDTTIEPAKSQYRRFRMLLRKMDEFLQITPEIRKETTIDTYLRRLVLDEAQFHFPEADVDAASLLLAKWESENCAANEVVGDDDAEADAMDEEEGSADVEEPAPKRRRKSSTAPTNGDKATGTREALLPPLDHDIFGEKAGKRGIMYGAARKRGTRESFVLNPQLIRYKRSGKAYGSNGLAVGAWFPKRIVALFHGAHSISQGGISGNTETGAYSIVIAGQYDDLDKDFGDVVYYSGSNSHDNENPNAPAPSSQGTRALQASLATGKPVRVLRASNPKSAYAPSVGLRYDGLYTVVDVDEPKNKKGGKYERFKLERIDGQPQIKFSRPSPEEIADFEKIKWKYA